MYILSWPFIRVFLNFSEDIGDVIDEIHKGLAMGLKQAKKAHIAKLQVRCHTCNQFIVNSYDYFVIELGQLG